MCGRFTLTTPAEIVAEYFELVDVPPLEPRYNIAPTQPVAAIRLDDQGRRSCDLLRWGLIPFWAKDASIGSRMINARADGVAEKPAFRNALKRRRCLVLADGFYEWQKLPGSKRKQPYYIRLREHRPFAFAGLWEHWDAPDGSPVHSCTIITTDANARVAPIHDRMPVILRPGDYPAWLDPANQDPAGLQQLLLPFPPEEMETIPIGTLVNRPANDSPDCLKPAS